MSAFSLEHKAATQQAAKDDAALAIRNTLKLQLTPSGVEHLDVHPGRKINTIKSEYCTYNP